MFASICPQKSILSAVPVVLLLFPASNATALEWSASPSVAVSTAYNNNISLRPGSRDPGWDYSVSPQLALGAAAADWSINGRAMINRLQYPGNPLQSHTDHLLDLTYNKLDELNQWSLAGNLTRDSTLDSELALTGIVLPRRAQRSSRTLAPSWTRSLTEVDSLTLGYSYNDVAYDNAPGSALLSYKTQDVNATLTRVLSEKNKASISFDYSDYKTDDAASPITSQYHFATVSTQLGYLHVFSETLNGSFMAGIHKTRSTTDFEECFGSALAITCFPLSSKSTGSGSLLNASLGKTYESSKLTANLTRSLQPTGNGGLVQTDHFALDYSADITARLNGSMEFNAYHTSSPNTSSTSATSRYYTLSPAFAWRMTEQSTGTARYTYTRAVQNNNNPQGTPQDTASNAIYLTFNYAWPKISISR